MCKSRYCIFDEKKNTVGLTGNTNTRLFYVKSALSALPQFAFVIISCVRIVLN